MHFRNVTLIDALHDFKMFMLSVYKTVIDALDGI